MFIQSTDQTDLRGRATELTTEPLPHNQVEAFLKAPSRTGLASSVGLLAAAIVCCAGMAISKNYFLVILGAPLFLGAIVGLCSVDHPIRSSVLTALAAILLLALSFAVRYGVKDSLYGVVLAVFTLPLVVPEIIIGALCTSTLLRHLRGLRARAALGEVACAQLVGAPGRDERIDRRAL